jgi:hypothetical protein
LTYERLVAVLFLKEVRSSARYRYTNETYCEGIPGAHQADVTTRTTDGKRVVTAQNTVNIAKKNLRASPLGTIIAVDGNPLGQ